MDGANKGDSRQDVPGTSEKEEDPETSARGRFDPASDKETTRRSSLHKPKAGGYGYDFSGSYDQTRRVRFKFGVHSLAVEATLAKLFESLTMECRHVSINSGRILAYFQVSKAFIPCVCILTPVAVC